MALWQVLLLSFLGYCGSLYGFPLFGCYGGWNTIGKPLVAGLVIGIIMGNVTGGILMGAAVQALFIGLVTPGGSMPGDTNLAAYIGIPLALASGLGTEYAVGISVPLSFLGSSLIYLVCGVNSFWVHTQEKWIEQGKLDLAIKVPLFGASTNFICRFVPIFICLYFGAPAVQAISENLPEWLGGIFILLGKMLPACGFGLLVSIIIKKQIQLLYFFIGFMLIAVFKIDIIPATIVAAFLAYIDVLYNKAPVTGGGE
ncbi:MAG: PTS sugar transporter subunit IIC [Treponema sp.]|nr:PTS sugar transporter subunit IIC [Treponema sp.]